MQNTTNYQLPKYQTTDVPNLITGYNSAMDKVDTQMKANADAASTADGKAVAAQNTANAAQNTANTANGKATTNAEAITALDTRVDALEEGSFVPSQTDRAFDVSALSNAKITANGIVYVPQSS